MERVNSCLIALRRILRSTEFFETELAKSVGLTPAQLRVLQVVAEKDWTTATSISDRMGISQATVTALVDKLVKQNLVRRQPAKIDKRKTDIVITDQGRRTVDDAPDALQQKFVKRFEALKDWEQAQLIASLERVVFLLNADDVDAAPILTAGRISEEDSPK